MRILYHLHKFPPYHNAGAELMALELLLDLRRRGHDVSVLSRDRCAPSWEDIPIRKTGPYRWLERDYRRADLVITHLDVTPLAMAASEAAGRPLVHIVHNDRQLDYHHVTPRHAALVVANSHWIADELAGFDDRLIVCYPPVPLERYETPRAGAETITLLNLAEAKGGPLFYDLARRLPDRLFLGVAGAYAHQTPAPVLDNLTIWRNRPDVLPVYRATRILLAPSSYESFGRVGIEAAASGIPTIAHPTPGLVESLGDAGIFADRADPDAWVAAIRRLDNPKTYAAASRRSRARAAELAKITAGQLDELAGRLEEVILA